MTDLSNWSDKQIIEALSRYAYKQWTDEAGFCHYTFMGADLIAGVRNKLQAPATEQPAERESLPLMARATAKWVFYRNWKYPPNPLPEPDCGLLCVDGVDYSIADTDEHGLPVVERADIFPGWKYRKARDCFSADWREEMTPGSGWQRIEDFNEHAQRGQEGI